MKKIALILTLSLPIFISGCTNPEGFFQVLLDPETGILAPQGSANTTNTSRKMSTMKPDTPVQKEAQAYARQLFR
ncbi:hypothetical protein VQ643_15735 [Pseudomonas sp. F1_0610]|uniref:hypothetical protein n=1 Tax=Pseudomonas sp. F1_0610 TaxID=3114284 RepID=UPI0039C04ACE